jgi:transcriptional regulator with XRE-family HTH domain
MFHGKKTRGTLAIPPIADAAQREIFPGFRAVLGALYLATQEELAQRLGTTQPAIAQLVKKGILTPDGDLDQWTREAWAYMADCAAGRRGPLAEERTRLAARQSEKMEIELAKRRGELAPLDAIAEKIFVPLINAIKTKILSYPSRCRSLDSSFTPRQIDVIDTLAREVLTELSAERLPAEFRAVVEKYYSTLHAAAETQSERMGGSLPISKSRKRGRTGKVANKPDPVPARTDGLDQSPASGNDGAHELEPGGKN